LLYPNQTPRWVASIQVFVFRTKRSAQSLDKNSSTSKNYRASTAAILISVVPDHENIWRFYRFPVTFASASAARRFAVRFFAAASDAFFARADRSSAVIVERLRLPPFDPIAAIACLSSAGVNLDAIASNCIT